MIIKSIRGTFSVQSYGKDQDKLIVKSSNKASLMKIFDEKRVVELPSDKNIYCVSLCKQEFVHTLILLVKEVNYSDFNQTNLDSFSETEEVFA